MRVVLDVQVVSVSDEQPKPEELREDFEARVDAALDRLIPTAYTASPEVEAERLLFEVGRLVLDLDDAIQNAKSKQDKNKRGIEIHGKLERAKRDLDKLKAEYPTVQVTDIDWRLHEATKALLKNIFGIESPSQPAPPEPSFEDKLAASGKVVAQKATTRKPRNQNRKEA
jgi:hypothetical protein